MYACVGMVCVRERRHLTTALSDCCMAILSKITRRDDAAVSPPWIVKHGVDMLALHTNGVFTGPPYNRDAPRTCKRAMSRHERERYTCWAAVEHYRDA